MNANVVDEGDSSLNTNAGGVYDTSPTTAPTEAIIQAVADFQELCKKTGTDSDCAFFQRSLEAAERRLSALKAACINNGDAQSAAAGELILQKLKANTIDRLKAFYPNGVVMGRRTKGENSQRFLTIVAACKLIGITQQTFSNWVRQAFNDADGGGFNDRRHISKHSGLNHYKACPQEERDTICKLFKDVTVRNISIRTLYYELLDRGDPRISMSLSTIYRILRQAGIVDKHKPHARRKATYKPKSHVANAPNKVWVYDITYLFGVGGKQFYGIAIVDYYSRYIVASDVMEVQSDDNVAAFLKKAFEQNHIMPEELVLHTDNGPQMKSAITKNALHVYGISESHSRPHVSNDNAVMERCWGSLKHAIAGLPHRRFKDIEDARHEVEAAVKRLNQTPHSSLNYVTPEQRYFGLEADVLAKRKEHVLAIKAKHPERWPSNKVMNCEVVGPQVLNPHLSDEPREEKLTKVNNLTTVITKHA